MNECVIERVVVEFPVVPDGAIIDAKVRGKPMPERELEVYYRHRETGQEFTRLFGGFQPSGFEFPGFALVMGIDRIKQKKGERILRVMDEDEAPDYKMGSLLKGIDMLRKKYGVNPLLKIWICNLDEPTGSQVSKTSQDLNFDFIWSPDPHRLEGTPFSWYLQTLRENTNILDRGNCLKLRNYMENGPQNRKEIESFKPEDNPAIAALAYTIADAISWSPGHYKSQASKRFDEFGGEIVGHGVPGGNPHAHKF